MRALVVIALAGCNAIFGNDAVNVAPVVDAQFFDAPIDAMPSCPAGTPAFRDTLYQIPAPTTCSDISFAENDTMVALCVGTTSSRAQFYDGDVASGLSLATTDLPPDSPLQYGARISPEGNLALVAINGDGVHALSLVGAHTWHDLGRIPILDSYVSFSTPTRGPQRHLLTSGGGMVLFELVGDGTEWTLLSSVSTTLNLQGSEQIGMTPDGLRVVATHGITPSFMSRPDLSSPFSALVPLDEPMNLHSLYMTEDCGRLFFIGLDHVLYVKQ